MAYEDIQNPTNSVDLPKMAEIINKAREQKPELPIITISEAIELFAEPAERELLRELSLLKPSDVGLPDRPASKESSREALVELRQTYTGPDGKVRNPNVKILPKLVYDAHLSMNAAYLEYLKALGINNRPGLIVASGYRSPGYQLLTLVEAINQRGMDIAIRNTGLPYYSEHSDTECTAVDYTCVGDERGEKIVQGRPVVFELYQEFDWLMKNGPNFGFALTLPPDINNPLSGYTSDHFEYEPWHWRFMGNSETAKNYMTENLIHERVDARSQLVASLDYSELLGYTDTVGVR